MIKLKISNEKLNDDYVDEKQIYLHFTLDEKTDYILFILPNTEGVYVPYGYYHDPVKKGTCHLCGKDVEMGEVCNNLEEIASEFDKVIMNRPKIRIRKLHYGLI